MHAGLLYLAMDLCHCSLSVNTIKGRNFLARYALPTPRLFPVSRLYDVAESDRSASLYF